MKKYSKRTFLKYIGLGLAFAPFISLYSACNNATDNAPGQPEPTEEDPETEAKTISEIYKAKPEDVVLLKREDTAFKKYNTAFNARIKKLPLYIAVCKTDLGIQLAIQFARNEKLPVTVKSGGHSFEGFSTNNDGLVINLSEMKKIEWLDTTTVALEPACLLQEIQASTFPKKRLVPSGSCGTVGIAGLTLGGGYGFFSRKYGLTCDSLIDVEFIDGLGNKHIASENETLFWALRGGGNGNFGVATKFIFKTHPAPQHFTAHVLKFRNLDSLRFAALLETWFTVSANFAAEDFSAFVLNGKTLTVLATTFGNTPALANAIEPLRLQADSKSTSNSETASAMKRYYGRTGPILFKNACAGLYKGHEDIAAIADQIFEKVTAAKGMIYQINTLGGAIADAQLEQQSCYPHRSLPYLSELQAYWEQAAQEQKLLTTFEDIQALIRQQGITAHYRNYPDINFPDWEQAYYGKNYAKLQNIKKTFDPENIFQYPQSVRATPRKLSLGVTFLFVLNLLNTHCIHAQTKLSIGKTYCGKSVRVEDGDTFVFLDEQNVQHKIRIEGIDAPEKGMPYARKAKEHLAALLNEKNICIRVAGYDQYKRTLAKINSGTMDIAKEMLQAGMAWHFAKYNREATYADAQKKAQIQLKGLWQEPKPLAPWVVRAYRRAGYSDVAFRQLRQENSPLIKRFLLMQ